MSYPIYTARYRKLPEKMGPWGWVGAELSGQHM